MADRSILDELIRAFQAHIEGALWEEEFIFDSDDSKAILGALVSYQARRKDVPALDIVIDGVRFVPVDSLAKES